MPRKSPTLRYNAETENIDCVSFYLDKGGKPSCKALKCIACLCEDGPCKFKLTAEEAAEIKQKVQARLRRLGMYDQYAKMYDIE